MHCHQILIMPCQFTDVTRRRPIAPRQLCATRRPMLNERCKKMKALTDSFLKYADRDRNVNGKRSDAEEHR